MSSGQLEEYDRIHASLYDQFATGVEGDVDFYVSEARIQGAPVLELGCGTGRILIPIAQAGISILGLDRSRAMLSVASDKAARLDAEARNSIQLVQGDMRSFNFAQRFNLVIIPYRGFLHLLTVDDQKQALIRIRQHLAPSGRLILNFFDVDLTHIGNQNSSDSVFLTRDSEFIDTNTGHRFVVWDNTMYEPECQVMNQYYILEELNEQGEVIRKLYFPLRRRYVHRYEMQFLLELSGFEVEALYGDFQKRPYHYKGEQIWIARLA
jgi:SAM-dependent methyltransferase